MPIRDDEALEAFQLLTRTEGIIPALEPAHALAEVIKRAPTMKKDEIIVMNLCGRGDKDIFTVGKILGHGTLLVLRSHREGTRPSERAGLWATAAATHAAGDYARREARWFEGIVSRVRAGGHQVVGDQCRFGAAGRNRPSPPPASGFIAAEASRRH